MHPSPDLPERSSAEIHVLFEGYVREPSAQSGRPDHVAGSVSFVRDGNTLLVIDPGMVPSQDAILAPLSKLGIAPSDVTDVVLSHHHPDHTLNAALFAKARVHDHGAVYAGDQRRSRPADRAPIAASVLLLETPGHTPQDLTTIVRTGKDVVAFTHLWLSPEDPDPFVDDWDALRAGRKRVLAIATRIVPGHGPPFEAAGASP